jgi:hypothetical protein
MYFLTPTSAMDVNKRIMKNVPANTNKLAAELKTEIKAMDRNMRISDKLTIP